MKQYYGNLEKKGLQCTDLYRILRVLTSLILIKELIGTKESKMMEECTEIVECLITSFIL